MSIDINMFWHGSDLGSVHAACMRSFIHHGHTVFLHCYERPRDLPDGVRTIDAATVMPRSELCAHRETGSFALGANRYRYRLISEGFGLYADCDMFCLRPIRDSTYIMGWEADGKANNAFLKFPPQSKLAELLLKATDDVYYISPWFRQEKQIRLRLLKKVGLGVHVGRQRWGVWGPLLLTHAVETLGLEKEVSPIDAYYPVHFFQKDLLRDPELRISDLVTHRTAAIHLWNQRQDKREPPKNSPLHEMMNC